MTELNIPSNVQILKDRNSADIENQIPEFNPVEVSWMRAVSDANANRQFDNYLQLQILKQLLFWDTTTGESLNRWANVWVGERNAASQSSGNAIATGTASSSISVGEQLTIGSETYEVTASSTIEAESISVTSLTSVGNTATAILASDQPLANNVQVTISGADQSQYNGTFSINITGTDSFEFTIVGPATSPATGTILAAFTRAVVPVESVSFGAATNQDLNAQLTFLNTLPGVDNQALVDFGELGGGTNQEGDTDYRSRMLERVRGFLAFFSVDTIKVFIRDNVAGVTKVWVFDPDHPQGGDPGQVLIYFIRGNDDNIIPSGSEITTVKNLMDSTQKPAHVASADVIVNAPTPVNTTFNFSSITPDTASMRTAIDSNLTQLFLLETEVGETLTQDKYRAIIQETFDTETGDSLESFTLSSPAGNIGGNPGELPVYGGSTFP